MTGGHHVKSRQRYGLRVSDASDAIRGPLAAGIAQAMEGLLPPLDANGLLGFGVDAEVITRFARPPLAAFTDDEVAYCRAQSQSDAAFAGTWCVKEAVVKALGGLSHAGIAPVGLRQVHVRRDTFGAVHVRVDDAPNPVGSSDPPPTVPDPPHPEGSDNPRPVRVKASVTYVDGVALAVVIVHC